MIQNFEIHNFRCFGKTKISEFSRINLIGGKNNSGKTALLEALYLNNSPSVSSVMKLRHFRGEDLEFLKVLPERAWDNFFFNQNRTEPAMIISEDKENIFHKLELLCDDSVEQFTRIIEDKEQIDEEMTDLRTLLSDKKYGRSALHLNWTANDKKHPASSMIAHSSGIAAKDLSIPNVREIHFIPASVRLSGPALAQEFDKADLNGHSDKVLKAIQVIDRSIVQIKTLNIGKSAVYLRRENQELLPISLFGESVVKVTDFILRLVNSRNGILLIDEIENGIHYTNQRELWRMLFKLSYEFNMQIFATTHSLEMIRAFADVGMEEDNEEIGAYFELAKNIRTDQMTGIKREMETLNYEVKQGTGFRGE